MKIRFALPLLFIALAGAQEKASTTVPTLTLEQKEQLSDALVNAIEAQSQLEHIPGYAELSAKAQATQKKFFELQTAACKSGTGKFQLDRSVNPKTNATEWSCKEAPAAPVKK